VRPIRLVTLVGLASFAALSCSGAVWAKVHTPEEVATRTSTLPRDLQREVMVLRYLLTYDELEELLSLGNEGRCRRWIDRYWADRDPIYTTEVNEERVEHERRVEVASSRFFLPEAPGWDQRGEVYIRYGEPTVRQPLHADVDATGITKPGEVWYYADLGMFVYFEDANSSGDYTYYTEHVRGPHSMRMARIADPIDAAFDAVRDSLPAGLGMEGQSQYSKFKDMLFRFGEMLESTPAVYPSDLDRSRLSTYFGVDCFRGGDVGDRVEVNTEYMVDMAGGKGGPDHRNYTATAVFWNTDREEVGRNTHTVTVPLAAGVSDSTRMMVTQLLFTLPPGFYHVALTVEEGGTGRFNSYRASVTCEEFVGKLAISDILFATRIGPAADPSPFNRGPLEVVPHPYRRYRRAASLPVYFEVYNLRPGRSGSSDYTVSYRIVPVTPRPEGFWSALTGGDDETPDVSSSFRSSSPGPDDVVHITIGTGNLWPGTFGLRVTVKDELTEATASREAKFYIVE
jgi:GWxTD domain-containing protein